ncbi:MAG: hypothetical protein AAFP76_04660 [Bacteroidota bacterium]
MKTSPTIIELDFITIELFESYAVTTIKDGVAFDFEHLETISEVFKTNYTDGPFVSIANRKFDYTVNPTCLMRSDYIPNLLGIAVICYSRSAFETALFEQKFYSKPFKVFHTLSEGIVWGQQLLQESSSPNNS